QEHHSARAVFRLTLTHPAASAPGSTLSRNAGEGAERQWREAGEGRPALTLLEKPSLVVLPFQNLTGDPEQEYFVDGMVEETITAIARLPWLSVFARNSAFAYKGKSSDLRQVGRELGMRYVLEGSVRKAGSRVHALNDSSAEGDPRRLLRQERTMRYHR